MAAACSSTARDHLRHSGAAIIVGLLVLAALAGDSALHPSDAPVIGGFRLTRSISP